MKTYTFTLSANGADASKTFVATLSESELAAIRTDINKVRYQVDIRAGNLEVDNKSNFKDLVEWLATTQLTRTEYILTKVTTEVVNLPDGITFHPEGYLLVDIGKHYKEYTHEDCLLENSLCHWILETFKTSQYHTTRNTFTLPCNREEYANKSQTVKHVFSISKSGNKAIEVTKRVYKKVTHIL
jgi:hypothetical protein